MYIDRVVFSKVIKMFKKIYKNDFSHVIAVRLRLQIVSEPLAAGHLGVAYMMSHMQMQSSKPATPCNMIAGFTEPLNLESCSWQMRAS